MIVAEGPSQASVHALEALKFKRPPPRRHPFSLQCLRVAAREQGTNVCLAPASIDAVVRLLAEGMQPHSRATTLRRLDPPPGPLTPEVGAGYHLRHGTAVFIDGHHQFEPAFAPKAAQYGAHLERLPGSLRKGKHIINAYAAKYVTGLVDDIFSDQVLNQNHLLLLDVIEFKAEWETKFPITATVHNFPFQVSPMRTSPCAMMFKLSPKTFVSDHAVYLAVKLRYKTDYMQPWAEFTALMPHKEATVDDVLRTLQREGFPTSYKLELLERLGLPKFKFEQCHPNMMSLLQASGMQTLKEPLQVTCGIHQSLNRVAQAISIEIDEEGTTARAKTFMLAGPGRGPQRPNRAIVFDRPFAFFVHTVHTPSHLLFAGVYTHQKAIRGGI